jgi:hypothetical protein
VTFDARGQVGGVLDRGHRSGEGGFEGCHRFGHWDQFLCAADGGFSPPMYTRVNWEAVNSIKATCTSVIGPNLRLYYVTSMYNDV